MDEERKKKKIKSGKRTQVQANAYSRDPEGKTQVVLSTYHPFTSATTYSSPPSSNHSTPTQTSILPPT